VARTTALRVAPHRLADPPEPHTRGTKIVTEASAVTLVDLEHRLLIAGEA
jgi:hypothetical protein